MNETGVFLGILVLCSTQIAAQAPTETASVEPYFVERSAELGVDFTHNFFGTGEKHMTENMGAGVALLDVDDDGRLDIYLVQGAPLVGEAGPDAANRLFRQTADGTFEDITAASGTGDRGLGMGVIHGDVNGDGQRDLYVTNFGRNALLLHRGVDAQGIPRFEDVTVAAGVEAEGWSAGATFFDPDGDGDLDLFVTHYVDFSVGNHRWCGNARLGLRSYCHPDVYGGVADRFYRNLGPDDEGVPRFQDASQGAGLRPAKDAKGLGVLAGDFDGDGFQDLYVANDSTMNHLYLGDGTGRFREEALLAGVGFNGAGAAEASMGLEYGDLDGDGRLELFATHLDEETNTLYRPQAPGLFSDATEASGLARPSLPWVGFGTVFFDVDHDGDLDVFVANGHILDNIALFDSSRSHRQPAQLFLNRGDGRFDERSDLLGLTDPLVGRGAAVGDLDGDGDLDLVVTQNGDRALLLINRRGQDHPSLGIRLVGGQSIGARLELTAGPSSGVREVLGASSYFSQGEPLVHFGLGDASVARKLVIRWPSGQVDTHTELAAGVHTLSVQTLHPLATDPSPAAPPAPTAPAPMAKDSDAL